MDNKDKRDLETWYGSLTTEQLIVYHSALKADRENAERRPQRATLTVAFCTARIALLEKVLGQRGVTCLT